MSRYYDDKSDSSSACSRELELVIDIFDDGKIQLASPDNCDERRGSYDLEIVYPAEPSLEHIFESGDRNRNTSEQNFLQVSDASDSDSDVERELVEMCPRKCKCCPIGSDGPDDMVMMEANILVKIPIKRECFERLIGAARSYQLGLK
ncbi:uncharacterized protein LOC131680596 [Topomyia yanbarensis]|uniref:uncharacterized protein LOC131680596 n=1 Tax=Topomyia yanbarensis TaxID=2498891 RepID=UPI00273C4BA8|nr:uncharacterized protein LOC131680596 [Topomyia yanbarensis]